MTPNECLNFDWIATRGHRLYLHTYKNNFSGAKHDDRAFKNYTFKIYFSNCSSIISPSKLTRYTVSVGYFCDQQKFFLTLMAVIFWVGVC